MRAILRNLLSGGRRLRFLAWAGLSRLRLAWWGVRLELDSTTGAVLGPLPKLQVGASRRRGGVLRIRIGRDVRLGSGVEVEVETGLRNELVLGDRVQLASGARLKLGGGAIEVSEGTIVRDFAVLKSSGELRVGAGSTLSYGIVIHCAQSVTLGPGVGLAEHTTVVDSDHRIDARGLPWEEYPISCEPVALERNTTILAGSVVLKGTTTGPGCVAAAGSLLRGRYPGASLVAGAPAAVVRTLDRPADR